MKMESQKPQQHVLFLATENVILHVNQPYKIRQDMIETKNFIPEAFLIHQFHDSRDSAILSTLPSLASKGSSSGRDVFSSLTPYGSQYSAADPFRKDVVYFSDEDDDEDDWDEEDEEWDEEDEDWDEDDEEWDEDDDEFDDDDDEAEDDWSEDEE